MIYVKIIQKKFFRFFKFKQFKNEKLFKRENKIMEYKDK